MTNNHFDIAHEALKRIHRRNQEMDMTRVFYCAVRDTYPDAQLAPLPPWTPGQPDEGIEYQVWSAAPSNDARHLLGVGRTIHQAWRDAVLRVVLHKREY